jgi:hypothetical protein
MRLCGRTVQQTYLAQQDGTAPEEMLATKPDLLEMLCQF